ncbi:winged helix-turn-helix domain-containing protein [Sagittula salina]|uniref:Winged helix-turn-helix domain-containing protein n=1 Tax=Sagittula salina TaxID=2820268 RepID=A0A940MTW2_9RHOB|nr:helix-turn-helix domain-containing protein [Sagittula salina]MBP0484568.1 winged helix-turn-helix domain-containing protein [Sagittula salina]
MSSRSSFTLVVERNAPLRNEWADLMRGAGLPRVLKRTRPSEVGALIAPGEPLSAMIVGLSARGAQDNAMLSLIASVRRQIEDAVILAVDHGDRSDGAVAAFAAGADDALRANPNPAELRARLAARLSRADNSPFRAAWVAQLGLTPIEERIFACLSARRDEIVTRSALAQELGETDWQYGDRRFDVHIARIRQKLRERAGGTCDVRTIRAQGYVLQSPMHRPPPL